VGLPGAAAASVLAILVAKGISLFKVAPSARRDRQLLPGSASPVLSPRRGGAVPLLVRGTLGSPAAI